MADDDVKFRIGFEDSPEAYQQLDKLATAVEDTQSRIADLIADIGKSAAQAAQMATAASEAMKGGGVAELAQQDMGDSALVWAENWQDARAQDLQNAQQHVMAVEQLAQTEVTAMGTVTDEFEAMWNDVSSVVDRAKDSARSIDTVVTVTGDEDIYRLVDEAEGLQSALGNVTATRAISQVEELNRQLDEASSEAEEVARLLEQAGMGTLAQEAAVEGQQKVKEAADSAKQAMDEEAERQKKFADDMLAANDKLEESWINSARSIGGAVRGLAMLTASQSEDVQAAIDMLLQVQGAIDVAVNSADAIKNVTRAMRDYGAARELAIQGVAAAGTQAAASRAAGGAIGSAASGAAGGVAGGAAGAGGLAIGGGAAALGSAIAAAVGGSLFAIFSGFKTGFAAGEYGVGGGATEGSFVDTVGGSDFNPFSWLIAADVKFERNYAEAMTERMQIERDLIAREKALAAQKLANSMEIMQLDQENERRRLSARESFELALDGSAGRRLDMLDNREGVNSRQIRETQGVLTEAESTGNYEVAKQAQQQIIALEEERQAMVQERLQLERQSADEQIRAAEESVRSLEQQLQLREQEQQSIEESLMTAKERFAALSEAEQQEAINIAKMVQAGQAESLTDEQRALGRRVGTTELTDAARQADVAEADRLGFDRFFGGDQRQARAESIQQQQDIKAEIQVQQDIKAEIQIDLGTLEKQLKEEFSAAERRLRQLAEQARNAAIEEQGREMALQNSNSSNVN